MSLRLAISPILEIPMRNRLFNFIFQLCVVVVSLLTISHLLRDLWWGFWLAEHLRVQLSIAILALMLIRVWRNRREAMLLGILLILNLVFIAPYLPRGSQSGAADLRMTHFSLDKNKTDAFAYLNARDDDILFLQELTPAAEEAIAALTNYEVVQLNAMDNTHGSGMLVRSDWDGEVIATEIVHLPAENPRPLLTATIEVDGQQVQVMTLHVIRPGIHPDRNAYFATETSHVANWALQQPLPVILIGDFNAAPWSRALEDFRRAGLQAGRRGHGLHPTWIAQFPWILRIPIDLTMVTETITVTQLETGPDLGSDHLPLHVGYALED